METQNFFPDFQPNQVLTNTQLNQLRQYLDDQNRLTRIRLVGAGIVCGLSANPGTGSSFSITGGYGVTSDGYIIEIASTTYIKYRNYNDPKTIDPGNSESEPYPEYEPWRTKSNPLRQIDILELMSDVTLAEPGFTEEEGNLSLNITPEILKDMVLVLYLEMENDPLRSCIVTDCNNKGENVNLAVTALLIAKSDLDTVIPCEKDLTLIYVPRLAASLHAVGLDLTDVDNHVRLNDAYRQIYTQTSAQVVKKVQISFDKYKHFLNLDYEFNSVVAQLENTLDDISDLFGFNQYGYDFIRDIARAYNEFAMALCPIVKECMFSGEFPRHLLLRAFISQNGQFLTDPAYRNCFLPSPLRNVSHENIKRVRQLFIRILKLANNFIDQYGDSLKITPGAPLSYPLGKQTIPVYYYEPEIRKWWQPDDCCELKPALSHHANLMDPSPQWPNEFKNFEHPLLLDPENHFFYHIAGHLHRNIGAINAELNIFTGKFNLPVKIISLRFAGNNDTGYFEICHYSDLQQQYFVLAEELKCLIRKLAFGFAYDNEIRSKLIEEFGNDYLNPKNSLFEQYHSEVLQHLFPNQTVELTKTFIEYLVGIDKYLTYDLADFNFDRLQPGFVSDYSSTLELAIKIKIALNENLLEIIRNKNKRYPAEFYTKIFLVLNEFLKWLDDFSTSCLVYKLAFVDAVFKYRLNYYNDNDPLIFSNFVKKHPGIEHIAGVLNGGTFILVNNGTKKGNIDPADVVADFSLPYLCCTNEFCLQIPFPKPEELNLPLIALPVYARVDFGEYFFTMKHIKKFNPEFNRDYSVINVLSHDVYESRPDTENIRIIIVKKGVVQDITICNRNNGGPYILPERMPTDPAYLCHTDNGQLAIAINEEGYQCFLFKPDEDFSGLEYFDYILRSGIKSSNLGKIIVHIPCCGIGEPRKCYSTEILVCWALKTPGAFSQALKDRGIDETGNVQADAGNLLETLRSTCGFSEDEISFSCLVGFNERGFMLECLRYTDIPDDYELRGQMIRQYQAENCCTNREKPCTVTVVHGFVRDLTGAPLFQVSIMLGDVMIGSTGDNGFYEVNIGTPGQTITFFLQGFQPKTVEICNEQEVNVTLNREIFFIPGSLNTGLFTLKEITGMMKERNIEVDPAEPEEKMIEKIRGAEGGFRLSKSESSKLTVNTLKKLLDAEAIFYSSHASKPQLIGLLFKE